MQKIIFTLSIVAGLKIICLNLYSLQPKYGLKATAINTPVALVRGSFCLVPLTDTFEVFL